MVKAKKKPIPELKAVIQPYGNILNIGCGGCVSVCLAGGQKEVNVLNAELSLEVGKGVRLMDIPSNASANLCMLTKSRKLLSSTTAFSPWPAAQVYSCWRKPTRKFLFFRPSIQLPSASTGILAFMKKGAVPVVIALSDIRVESARSPAVPKDYSMGPAVASTKAYVR